MFCDKEKASSKVNPFKYVQYLNVFGHRAQFEIDHGGNHKTKLGIIWSLCLFSCISMITAYFAIQFFDKTDPVVQYSEFQTKGDVEIPDFQKHVFMRLGLFNVSSISEILPPGRLIHDRKIIPKYLLLKIQAPFVINIAHNKSIQRDFEIEGHLTKRGVMGQHPLAPGGSGDAGDGKILITKHNQFAIVGCDDHTLARDNYETVYDLGAWAKAGAPERYLDLMWLCMNPEKNITLSATLGDIK
jgi:hypothetical protein